MAVRDRLIVFAIGAPWMLGRGAVIASNWSGERVEDLSRWAVNLIRDLPWRLLRLARTLWQGLVGVYHMIPAFIRACQGGGLSGAEGWLRRGIVRAGAWLGVLALQVLDIFGIPELFELLWHAVTHSTPLTGSEIAVLAAVLGPSTVRYRDVRVNRGGALRPVFALNRKRAFTAFHTVNMPGRGSGDQDQLDILVHEMVHVFQHERLGSVYLGQCLYAQATVGYGYDGTQGLRRARIEGTHYRDYNREQQAQIVQDYYWLRCHGWDSSVHEPFVQEMREGKL